MLLLPFAAFIATKILKQDVLWTDDTPVMFFDRDGPMSMLADWSGFLHADAYSGYDSVIHASNGLIIEVACWAHARRYFEQALHNDRKVSGLVLEWVRQLYDIEDRALLMSDDERLALRKAESVPILRRMGAWLKVDDDGVFSKNAFPDGVLPKEAISQAIGYTNNHWAALQVYVSNAHVPIDNNLTEQLMKQVATGRKNWRAPEVPRRTSGRSPPWDVLLIMFA